MQTTLAFVVVLGGLIMAHEFGHYLVARLHGVRVETFSVGIVIPGSPADRAGFRPADRILGAGASCECTLTDVRAYFDANMASVVDVVIQRGSQTELIATPHPPGRAGRFDSLGLVLRIEPMATALAATAAATSTLASTPPAATDPSAPLRGAMAGVRGATRGIWNAFSSVPAALEDAIDDGQPERLIVGPIGIARLCGQAANAGWIWLVGVAAMISLGLAPTNLLPIPVLDGGQICILAIEALCRRDASIGTRTALTVAGLTIVLGLMGTATYFDVRALW